MNIKINIKEYSVKIYIHCISLTGSVAHGLNNEYSDKDIKVVFSYYLKDKENIEFKLKTTINSDIVLNLNEIKEQLKYLVVINDIDDLFFIEAKDFSIKLLKSSGYFLDIIQKTNILYRSSEFDIFLKKTNLFFSLKEFYSHLIKEKEDINKLLNRKDIRKRDKDICRSLHNLYIIEDSFKFNMKYKSKISDNSKILKLKSIRSGNYNINEVVLELKNLREELYLKVEPFLNRKDKKFDMIKINKLVRNLNLFEIYRILK